MNPSLLSLFAETAARHPGRAAVLWDGGAVSYRDLAVLVERLGRRLHELGLAGRRVGVLLPNLPTFPLVLHGALRADCSVLLLNPLSSPREVAEHLADAEVDTVLTVGPLAPLLPAGSHAVLVDALPAAVHPRGGEPIPLEGAAPAPEPGAAGDAEAVVLFTAANDGRARGAPLSHANLVANLRSTVEAMELSEDDRLVAALPLVHAFGLTVTLNAPLAVGASVIPMERFAPMRVLEILEERGATLFAGVPAMFIGLLGAAERRGVPRHSLRVALCGGAPLEPEIARRWEAAFGLPLRQGYGLTEAGPVCLFNRVDRPNRIGSLGYPFPGVDVRIVDPRGAPVPAGEVGEICVRGPNVFRGYLGEPCRDGRAFHGEWLRTGDLGSSDPDGAVRFRGMLKSMFTRNGFNVYPREVERALESDPRISRARLCAQPSPTRENELVLFVRPAAGTALSAEEVREVCRARLAAYKQPGRIEIEGAGE